MLLVVAGGGGDPHLFAPGLPMRFDIAAHAFAMLPALRERVAHEGGQFDTVLVRGDSTSFTARASRKPGTEDVWYFTSMLLKAGGDHATVSFVTEDGVARMSLLYGNSLFSCSAGGSSAYREVAIGEG